MNDAPARLRVHLPGVVSWSRPRHQRGRMRYPSPYARDRDAWALVVAQAVRDRSWRPAPEARFGVAVAVSGGGKRDLDRVCTAVLDALQAGGAFRDDCLVDELEASRAPATAAHGPSTEVEVTALRPERRHPDGQRPRPGRRSL